MDSLEQGSLKITGADCFGAIEDVRIHQALGSHGCLTATLWLLPSAEHSQMGKPLGELPMALIPAGREREPIFSGIIKHAHFLKIKGRDAVQIKAYSYTVQLDQTAENRSFQMESRTYGELVRSILAPYQAAYIWGGEGRDEPIRRFLMQYRESGWEFLRRAASLWGHPIIPEVRFPGAKMFIGLPKERKEQVLECESYRIRKHLAQLPKRMDQKTTGGMTQGLEILINDRSEEYRLGDVLLFLGGRAVVAEKHSSIKGSRWVHDYVLKPAHACRMEPMDNLLLMGASVRGTVIKASPDAVMLALHTDQAGERPESWHTQPVYYAGNGKGYSGQPEIGDTLYLYFPTMREEDRYIIGGADAGAEPLNAMTEQCVPDEGDDIGLTQGETPSGITAAEPPVSGIQTPAGTGGGGAGAAAKGNGKAASPPMPSQPKSWATPGKQSLSLNGGGIWLKSGSKSKISLSGSGILVHSKNNLTLEAPQIQETGKKVCLKAKEYIWINCQNSGFLLLPDAVHMKAVDIFMKSPLSASRPIMEDWFVPVCLSIYEEAKKQTIPLFAPDGSVIKPHGYRDILKSEDLQNYFRENVYGTGEYENPFDQGFDLYYDSWVEEIYGKTNQKKFWDHMTTLDGFQDMLDVVGIVLDPVDLANAVVSLCRGNKEEAALTAMCAIPWVGDMLFKGTKKAAAAAGDALTKLGRNRLIESMEFTYKTASDKAEALKKYLDDAFGGYGGNGNYRLAFDGGYLDEGSEVTFKIVDDSGDVTSYSRRLDGGNKVEGGGGTGGNGNKFKWGNSKSKPTYGHAFSEHGAKKTTQQLMDRARDLGHQVGKWTDDQKAADFIADIAKRGEGIHDVPLPSDVSGKSFLPEGIEIKPDRAIVVVKSDGSIRTAYPYNSAYPTSKPK